MTDPIENGFPHATDATSKEPLTHDTMKAPGHSARQTVRPLRDHPNGLPRVDPDLARLTRLLCDARLQTRLRERCGVNKWQVSLGDAHGDALCWIGLQHDGACAWIGLDVAEHPALAALDGDESAPLACAVAGLLLTPLIDLLETLGAADTRVVSIGRRAPAHRNADGRNDGGDAGDTGAKLALNISCVRDTRRYVCRLGPAGQSWIDLIERQLTMHRPPLAPRLADIRVPGYLLVGEKPLAIATLRRLRPGDVVLRFAAPALHELDGTTPAPALALRWGVPGMHQYVARATLDGSRLVLDTDPAMTYHNDHPGSGAPDADSQTSIDELDLPVKFEIETVNLPLSQLAALRTGYVLELPSTLRDARVRLVSYGQLIGLGELVTVGEQLGVRVVEMFGSHDAD